MLLIIFSYYLLFVWIVLNPKFLLWVQYLKKYITLCTSQCHKNWFFSEISLAQKKLCLSIWDWPNLFSLAKSNFISQIYFHWLNPFCEIYDIRPSAKKTDFFPKKFLAQKRHCLSMWDWCRFNEVVRNPLISSTKVVISTSRSNKAWIIIFMLKTSIKLDLIAHYSSKSSYIACKKAIQKWSRFVIQLREKKDT